MLYLPPTHSFPFVEEGGLAQTKLTILLEEPYPRRVHQSEYWTHWRSDLEDATPDTTASVEIIEHNYNLYFPTHFSSYENAVSNTQISFPVKIVLGDAVFTVTDSVHHATLDQLQTSISRHQLETTKQFVLESNKDTFTVDADTFDAAASDGTIEFLIPLDITARKYQTV